MDTKICVRCTTEKPTSDFALDKRHSDGLASWCRECRNEYQRQRRDGKRKCIDCKQVKPVTEFSSTRICKTCEGTKVCKVCGKRLAIERFDTNHGKVCRSCRSEIDARRYKENRSSFQERSKRWREENAKPGSEYRIRQEQNRQKLYAERRNAVFAAYGGPVCACCGETENKFLTIDHVNGGGNKHRDEIRTNIIDWLYRNGFPPGFQILCYNCNIGRERNGGICPHKQKEISSG